MHVFITGTDTNIGKTLVASWLALHTGYDYFKPIQTGSLEATDSQMVRSLTNSTVHKETYCYQAPLSPHLAAHLEQQEIDVNQINLPRVPKLILEGAGGVLVPINREMLLIDWIKRLSIPVILVASSRLGTINHTLLSLEALRTRNIEILGIIMSGELNQDNSDAIAGYGQTKVIGQLPFLQNINQDTLKNIPLTTDLKKIFGVHP